MDDTEVVKLIGQSPPIDRMDDSLNKLKSCRVLSLSSNCIINMSVALTLKNLEVLSLARNQIKRIQGLDEVGTTLKELWISYNYIEKLEGLQSCVKLTNLYITHNRIKSLDEVAKLSQLPSLKDLLIFDNPFYGDRDKETMKPLIIKRVPGIEILDGQVVTEAIKAQALETQD
eukprot:TRINITY_DN7817_c0_g4_i2.p2 TRINITY_DN7817_c0_g4~~TRINITY_DN7817_c0_g4_i2.p2  ORF type:complete len:173 (-),score=64.72 TRINITY_DN7817_c0_g4_i2:147-665(-)